MIKRISIIGAGKSGIAAAKLAKHLGLDIFISEMRKSEKVRMKIEKFGRYEMGVHSKKIFDSDLIILSPGIPLNAINDNDSNKVPIISEVEFAYKYTKSSIMAITGSNGKSTTVSLLYKMVNSQYSNAMLGGNIGVPFSQNVLLEKKNKLSDVIHILELSSFQIETLKDFQCDLLGLTNLKADHLDRYKTFDKYAKSKLKIIKHLKCNGTIIFNNDDDNLNIYLKKNKNKIPISVLNKSNSLFSVINDKIVNNEKQDFIIDLKNIHLKGKHNYYNILIAMHMASSFGIKVNTIKKNIKNFKPLEHRLEFVKNINGVSYYNDSKATNINSVIAAVSSFKNNIILILGGSLKGQINLSLLLNSKNITYILCYGDAGKYLIKNFHKLSVPLLYKKSFNDIVNYSTKIAKKNQIVLLSPGFASYDQFKNFEARGDNFKRIIESYAGV